MTSLINGSIIEKMLSDGTPDRHKNIFRAPHDKTNPYTLISNRMLRDKNLRHSERGLLCQILSWTDYHFLCINALVKFSKEGRDAIRGMIDRLIAAGYIRKFQQKDVQGQFSRVVYQVYEQSTGEVLAELDMAGMKGKEEQEDSPQLSLAIDGDSAVSDQNNGNVNQSANGKPVSGKPDTKNNYDSRNTNIHSNSEVSAEDKKPEAGRVDLLKRWHLQMDNPDFKARLCMAGMQTFLVSQQQLDNFLIDFNQGHEKYGNVSESQRIKNFVVYLIGIKNTPAQYAKHVARLRALGVYMQMPAKAQSKPKPAKSMNPFDVKPAENFQVDSVFQQTLEDEGF
ncbi:hypothetical protein [Acinetobacter sp. ANC 3813]|uniref:hypothetical protein n=1 Tax=Acinetobacter sp. ANC 3813 TaxID=1977873 RepID=UPI000A357FBC|nr:hypothetical protein [Acinetobacter sp. ANC 3813]OTG87850.1 hypothetical protein B9T34_16065 [Acinetobacter sp. ANC 3813]